MAAARRDRLARIATATRSVVEVLPPGDPQRAHFEAQAERYVKLSGEHGRDLAAYLI